MPGRAPTPLFPIADTGRRSLVRHQGGATAVIFALALIPLILAAGAAVDYGRGQLFRSALQGAVDSAALAGASVYVDAAHATAAVSAATASLDAAILDLPGHTGPVRFTATPAGVAGGYTVAVTARATMPTILMAMFRSSLGIGAAATAINPIVAIAPAPPTSGNTGVFSSNAADKNSIYWYIVPSDGSLPTLSSANLLYSNAPGFNNGAAHSISAAASQRIGFALVNVTGGLTGYGTNGFNARQGTTHVFYSHLFPPSQDAASSRYETYARETRNCSLQVAVVSDPSHPPTPTSGSCLSSASAYNAPSCTAASGKVLQFFWNDMGGSRDDMDYNDAVYTFSCTASGAGGSGGGSGGSSSTSVHLIR